MTFTTHRGQVRRFPSSATTFATLARVQSWEQRAELVAAQRRLVGEPEGDWPESWRPFGVVAR